MRASLLKAFYAKLFGNGQNLYFKLMFLLINQLNKPALHCDIMIDYTFYLIFVNDCSKNLPNIC